MKNLIVLIVFISIVVLMSYLYDFTLSKVFIASIAYFAYLKKDSWIDKTLKEENKTNKNVKKGSEKGV